MGISLPFTYYRSIFYDFIFVRAVAICYHFFDVCVLVYGWSSVLDSAGIKCPVWPREFGEEIILNMILNDVAARQRSRGNSSRLLK